jgi:hypothetical protein
MNLKRTVLAAATLAALLPCLPVRAARPEPANALLVVPSGQVVFNPKFQEFMDAKGARLLEFFQPNVFIGYIPKGMEGELESAFGAQVYREKVDDWSSFAKYGERAVLGVNTWNKRFVDDPPAAPLVISSKVQKAGRKGDSFLFSWNEVMKASAYRLQISSSQEFSSVLLDTLVARNSYRFVPALWTDGVYYWRVAGLLRLNTGETRDGAFSKATPFAVSGRMLNRGARLPSPPVPKIASLKYKPLSWASPVAFKYYRLQISDQPDLSAPLVDVFTDTCSYRLYGLNFSPMTPYYMRVRGSDGAAAGDWSTVSQFTLEPLESEEAGRNR